MTKLSIIKNIAKQVRKAFEEIAENEKEYSYGNWKEFHNSLRGYCAAASVQLYYACKKKGIKLKLIEGIGHAYNEFDDYIIDITATQFGRYPKVHIRKKYKRPPCFYKKMNEYNSANAFMQYWFLDNSKVKQYRKIVNKYLET